MPNPRRDTTAGQVFNDLRNLALRNGRNTEELLMAYALERFLLRLSMTAPQRFVLKGGLLLALFGSRRPTRDVDLLGRGVVNSHEEISSEIARICAVEVDDGVQFAAQRIRTATIREDADYTGVRVILPASLGRAQLKLSLDVNFGDPVTPGPRRIRLVQLLSAETFDMLGYPIETVIAEKLTTAVALGDANTRDRDYADIHRLVGGNDLAGDAVTEAVLKTAAYRGIELMPLSHVVHDLAERRQSAYAAWRRRQGPDAAGYPESFREVVAGVVDFADPLLTGAAAGADWSAATRRWSAGSGR
ncbi:nucleotidyl transferase AbiEii/AbiGii toxin family protein [Catellatospora citrea]|uniref:Nucleotidyltransferase AbiEii toxin of type IV toxin-antitoxin system n=1 Tax=Catellatospora citrea TaxID=53366 RepID=A0A8J3NX23_9ACTN|nr:nucleotidyl transferase AbiEii/AbiGii toxin family protein [Catellatospora citrea]RKE07186.1 nucleotidyltransferase AbiEii toxin of type IV toxin-antitoxin system [Catellatospora citrea]GIF95338.1 hypothetical protein Cci01nite_04320 [Catellatospora citrea]